MASHRGDSLQHHPFHKGKRRVMKLIFRFAPNYSCVHPFSSWIMVPSSSCSNSGCLNTEALVPPAHGHSQFYFVCPLQAVLFLAGVSYSAICSTIYFLLSSHLIFSLILSLPLSLSVCQYYVWPNRFDFRLHESPLQRLWCFLSLPLFLALIFCSDLELVVW